MPHMGEHDLNDVASTRVRAIKADMRARRSYLPAKVMVGTTLLHKALDALDAVERLQAQGWAIADDGDPYRPGGGDG